MATTTDNSPAVSTTQAINEALDHIAAELVRVRALIAERAGSAR